jgi:predicted dehydrogenase
VWFFNPRGIHEISLNNGHLMSETPIRLGIIGCGLATRNLHWPAIKALQDQFKVIAVCNHTRPKAESFAVEVGAAQIFTDHRELLSSGLVEAVLVCLPINVNAEVSADCLNAGLHVLCEKPLAHDLEPARELTSLAEKSKTILMVGENYYYRDDYHAALSAITSGHIGKIFLVQYSATGTVDHTQSYGATKWRQKPRHRGGFVSDGGVHHAATLRLFGGEVARVQAFSKNVHPVIKAEDNLVASLQFTSGVLGSYSATYTASDAPHTTTLRIFGTEGTIDVGHGELHISGQHAFARKYEPFDNGMSNQWRAFYEAVRHGKNFPSTPRACLVDQELVWAMLDSADTGKIVDCLSHKP